MTACNAFVMGNAAYLATDTAWFEPTSGRVRYFKSKVVASERLLMAFAETNDRDSGGPTAVLSAVLGQAESQRDAWERIPPALRSAYEGGPSAFRILVAMWDNCGPQVFHLHSPRPDEGRPFFWHPGRDLLQPSIGIIPAPSGDPREAASSILHAQRQFRWDNDGNYRVGGAGELTTVDASGIRTETIVRWPDRIGRKINPCPGGGPDTLLSRLFFREKGPAHEKAC